MATKYTIDANQLLDWFVSPFTKFYGKTIYEPQIYDEFDSLIEVRIAKSTGYLPNTKKLTFDEMTDILEDKSASYNEVVGNVNKLFFDIDNAVNQFNFEACLDFIEQMIQRFKYNNVDRAYTKSTSTLKPHSYHVVYQIKASLQMNLYIAKEVNKHMNMDIIDESIYSDNKSLRLPNSPKYCERSRSLVQVYHRIIQGSLSQMFISNT
jgi:hypothetical protein